MKEYIKTEILKLIELDEEKIKIEIPIKYELGDYSIQCSNLRNDQYNNPIEIANLIKEKFNDKEKYFKTIKIIGPYVNFYLDNEKYSSYYRKLFNIMFCEEDSKFLDLIKKSKEPLLRLKKSKNGDINLLGIRYKKVKSA